MCTHTKENNNIYKLYSTNIIIMVD